MVPPQADQRKYLPLRPPTRHEFEIAIICALTLEADAVGALFDKRWDNDAPPYDKAFGDPNAYTTGAIGRHNVVLAHMPGMGKANAAAVAAHCHASFPSIRLAVVVGICGAAPFSPDGSEVVLGDVIISDGVVQYDFGRRNPDGFVSKDTLLDSLGRPNAEIRALLAKLKTRYERDMLQDRITGYLKAIQGDSRLKAHHPGTTHDSLFEATYRHVAAGKSCSESGCNGPRVPRKRLEQGSLQPQPSVHFGLIASGDTVLRSGEDRDAIAKRAHVVGFEMEGAGVWDNFPCVIIKGVCDYADSHKTKSWQHYAAAAAAAGLKAFLDSWVPLTIPHSGAPYPVEQSAGPWFVVPHLRNDNFAGRADILMQLQKRPLKSTSQTRASLFGLGGIGKTQIVLEYAYRLREENPDISVFWVRASNADQFRQSFHSIALECGIPGYDDPQADVLQLVKRWLERSDRGSWLMIIDNADDAQLFFPTARSPTDSSDTNQNFFLAKYIPECAHGSILVTTRNKQVGLKLAMGTTLIEVHNMTDDESQQVLRLNLREHITTSSNPLDNFSALASRLEYLPLALVQAATFIRQHTISVDTYLELLDHSDQSFVTLLSEEFEAVGRDSGMPHAVAATWIISFEEIEGQDSLAGRLLCLMSLFDRQAIPMEFLSDFNEQEEGVQYFDLIKALGVLKAYSLVTERQGYGLDMHRLVQLVTRKWLTTKGTMPHFIEKALLTVSHCYPPGTFETRKKCTAYLPHVQAVLKLESIESRDADVARASILHCAADLFLFEGEFSVSEEFRTQAEAIRRKTLGPDHPDTLETIARLAVTYSEQGRWKEAESLHQQVIERRKAVLGADDLDTLSTISELASTYLQQGRLKEAESLDVQVMKRRKAVLGPEHPDTLLSMANLASTYWKQGRLKKAESLDVQVMERRKAVLGPEHPDTLTNMANLALTYWQQGQLKEAESLQVQVMERRKAVLGPEHPDTLTNMANLALTYWQQGQLKEAESLDVQVMKRRKAVLGPDHPDTLLSMANLAVTWNGQGRSHDAFKLMEQCAQARIRILGPEHPDTQLSLSIIEEWRTGQSTIQEMAPQERHRMSRMKGAMTSIRARLKRIAPVSRDL